MPEIVSLRAAVWAAEARAEERLLPQAPLVVVSRLAALMMHQVELPSRRKPACSLRLMMQTLQLIPSRHKPACGLDDAPI